MTKAEKYALMHDALVELRDALKPVMTITGGTRTNKYGYAAAQLARETLWKVDGYPDGRGGFVQK